MERTAFPRVTSAEPLPSKLLLVVFDNGARKLYDCAPLLGDEAFQPLQDDALFRCAHADDHGHGVIWNDDIDLAESELWLHGTAIESDSGTPAR